MRGNYRAYIWTMARHSNRKVIWADLHICHSNATERGAGEWLVHIFKVWGSSFVMHSVTTALRFHQSTSTKYHLVLTGTEQQHQKSQFCNSASQADCKWNIQNRDWKIPFPIYISFQHLTYYLAINKQIDTFFFYCEIQTPSKVDFSDTWHPICSRHAVALLRSPTGYHYTTRLNAL